MGNYLYGLRKYFQNQDDSLANQALEMDWAKPCRFLKGSV